MTALPDDTGGEPAPPGSGETATGRPDAPAQTAANPETPETPETSGETPSGESLSPIPAAQPDPDGTAGVEELDHENEADAALETSEEELDDAEASVIDSELMHLLHTPLGLRGAVEALLFSSPEPLTARRIAKAIGMSDLRLVTATLQQLQTDYDNQRRGVQILETTQGFQMATRELFGDLILNLRGRKRRPSLSQAALETLAIIAYRQPIIRAEVEAVRGVESSGTIRNLIDMGLVEMVGRKDVIGRPPMYGTTETFLNTFGLKQIEDLPSIGDLKRHADVEEKKKEAAEVEKARSDREAADKEASETAKIAREQAARTAEEAQTPDDGIPDETGIEPVEDEIEEGWGEEDGEDDAPGDRLEDTEVEVIGDEDADGESADNLPAGTTADDDLAGGDEEEPVEDEGLDEEALDDDIDDDEDEEPGDDDDGSEEGGDLEDDLSGGVEPDEDDDEDEEDDEDEKDDEYDEEIEDEDEDDDEDDPADGESGSGSGDETRP